MPGRFCSVCTSKDRAAINEQLLAGGTSNLALARKFGVTDSSLRRHRANHMARVVREAQVTAPPAPVDPNAGRRGPRRTSQDPHADRWRASPGAELAAAAPALVAHDGWSESTRRQYDAYMRSEAARALRAEDEVLVIPFFDYCDRREHAWAQMPADVEDMARPLQAIRALDSMIAQLARALGIGPRSRRSLGITTEVRAGSRLEAFVRGEHVPPLRVVKARRRKTAADGSTPAA